jgi:hypothetical protein
MGVYADVSARLIEHRFAVIPIIPGTKKPGLLCEGEWVGLCNWQKRFNRGVPSATIRARWAEGDTGIGVVTGKPSGGTVAVDIDTDDPKVLAAILAILPATPIKKRGFKGETLFYLAPDIKESKSWNIDGKRIVDLIGPGRQTVLPPTCHPDTGLPYVWTGTGTLEDVRPEKLPALGDNIADTITAALTPFGYDPKSDSEPCARNGSINGAIFLGDDDVTPHRELNNLALANLSAWVPDLDLYRCRPARGGYEAVPIWRPSTVGRASGERHLNLKISPRGIRDFGGDQGYTPLDLVMVATECSLEEAFVFLAEHLEFDAGEGIAIELATAEAPAPEPISSPVPADSDPLEAYTHCPGLVGDIVDFITDTARRPNRVLALGAAVTVVGTLISWLIFIAVF